MNTTSQKPTIGRIVHYQQVTAYGPDTTPEERAKPLPLVTRAALVTGVRTVDGIDYPILRVHGDYQSEDFTVDCSPGGHESAGVHEAASPTMGCWNWPPRT